MNSERIWQLRADAVQHVRATMRAVALMTVGSLALLARPATGSAQLPARTAVDVGGHKVSVLAAGAQHGSTPTVVFENGFGSPLTVWTQVQTTVAESTHTIAFERPGVGQSEASPAAGTVARSVADLHELLAKLGAKPPYVLVSHSWGGPLIHSYATKYPKEIAGLVYVDPTDFTETAAEMREVGAKANVKDAVEMSASMLEAQAKSLPEGMRAEAAEIARQTRAGFAELREAGPAPRVPTAVLLAGKIDPLPPGTPFPGNPEVFAHANLDVRVKHFSALVDSLPQATLVLTSRSGHFVQLTEPELVIEQVRRVLAAATPHPELDRLTGRYQLTPNVTVAITRDGAILTMQLSGQNTFRLRSESPAGATPTRFAVELVPAEIEFKLDASGAAESVALVQNGQTRVAPRIP